MFWEGIIFSFLFSAVALFLVGFYFRFAENPAAGGDEGDVSGNKPIELHIKVDSGFS